MVMFDPPWQASFVLQLVLTHKDNDTSEVKTTEADKYLWVVGGGGYRLRLATLT